ncbi:MAG: EamA/RhaT family transporter [Acetilactobacillus jinshanensis]
MRKQSRGLLLDIIGCICWGVSGTFSQYLFDNHVVSVWWIAGIRALIAGIVILGAYKIFQHGALTSIWHHPHDGLVLLAFTFLGMLPWQVTYFLAIKYSNAPTATVLQFTGPVFIILTMSALKFSWPRRIDVISIVISMAGLILLVTNGRLTRLALAPLGVLWGVMTGVTQATYTLIPRKLLDKYNSELILGWAMLLGSFPLVPKIHFLPAYKLTPLVLIALAVIIFGGTIIGYLFYLISLKYLRPTVTGMLDCFEPLTATILSVIFLGTRMTWIEVIGALMILLTAFLQAIPEKR